MARILEYRDLLGAIEFVPKHGTGLSFVVRAGVVYRRAPRQEHFVEVRLRDAFLELRLRDAPDEVFRAFQIYKPGSRNFLNALLDSGEYYIKKINRISSQTAGEDTAKELIGMAKELIAKDSYDATLGAAIDKAGKKIKGWKPYWEYPGFVSFTNPKYPGIQVNATPWFESSNSIDVQVGTEDGDFLNGFEIRFPKPDSADELDGDELKDSVKEMVEIYFKEMSKAWPKVMRMVEAG